ncbi:MAG: hypothetical protein QXF82_07885 [Nitrososphaeria archaeon]
MSQKYKREYRSWVVTKNACLNKNCKKYPLYGEKGVTFDESWMTFKQFFEDMGKMPTDCNGLVLSDKTKGYNKFNAKWGQVKSGKKTENRAKHKKPKNFIENGMNCCLTINADHYAYIKRQAVMRSKQVGEVITTNELIREALVKAYPYAGQYDMFGAIKK